MSTLADSFEHFGKEKFPERELTTIRKIVNFSLKNNLQLFRLADGISQSVLAERIGVSRQTLNAIENNKKHPSLLTAFKIAWYFDKDLEEIFSYDVLEQDIEGGVAFAKRFDYLQD